MTGHIFIYGEIGRGLGQTSINTVRAQVDPKATDYELHMVTPGGDVFEGFGIYNFIKNTGKPVVTRIEGLCASIGTLIAFAGEKIIMNRTSEFMIHNPHISDLKGDAAELRNVASQLDKIKSLLIDVSQRRAARNGKSISTEKLMALYDNETWLLPDQARDEYGFVDEVVDGMKAVAKLDLNSFKMEEKDKGLIKFIKNLFTLKKFKNEFTETLADGTVVIVMSEDGDWTGKTIVREDGAPLEAGDYTLASGKVITVDANSTVTQVGDAPAPEDNKPEDMEKIKQLEEQLAAAKASQAAAEAKVAALDQSTAALSAKFEARFKELDEKAKQQEQELKKVVGTAPVTKKGPVFANLLEDNPAQYGDPMGEDALKYLKARNRV